MLSKDIFTSDLTKRAEDGHLAPVFGRLREMFAVLEVLARTTTRNVLLAGYSGVGKTRLVEGLAVSGVRGDTQELMGNFRIVELDLGALSSGTAELTERLIQLIRYLRQERDTILFIDNVHLVFDDEAAEIGALEVHRTLRPALARGDISTICTTTPEQLTRLTARDANMFKSFEIIPIEPMSEAATYELLTELKPSLERRHKIKIHDAALRAAIRMSEQYMPNRFLPGKAVEILDQACVRYRFKVVARNKFTELVDDKSWMQLKDEVSPYDIRKTISRVAQLPPPAIATSGQFTNLATEVCQVVLGQDAAISKLTGALQHCMDRLKESARPRGMFLLAGPRGCGKAFAVEQIVNGLSLESGRVIDTDLVAYDQEELLARISGLHEEQTLLGIGAGQGQKFSAPGHYLIFRHLERATSETIESLLDLFTRGTFEINRSRTVFLKNCLVFITADLSEMPLESANGNERQLQWTATLRQTLSPKLLNLVDDVIPFRSLDRSVLKKVIRARLTRLSRELASSKRGLVIHRSAYDWLLSQADVAEYGAERLMTLVDEVLIEPLHELLNTDQIRQRVIVHVRSRDDSIVFQGEKIRKNEA